MADHVRKQIRDFIVTAVTGLVTTTTNVFPSRVYNIEESKLPALLIYTKDEASGPQTITYPRSVQRNLEVVIEGVAAKNATLDDTLDTIIKEVEVAVIADPTLGGLAKDTMLTPIEIGLTGDAQNPTGNARMTFTVEYYILENNPTVAV